MQPTPAPFADSARAVAGGEMEVVPFPQAPGAQPTRLPYEVWVTPTGRAWVDVYASPDAAPLRLEATTIDFFQTVLNSFIGEPAPSRLGMGVEEGALSMTVNQQWSLGAALFIAVASLLCVLAGWAVLRGRRRTTFFREVARHEVESREAERTRIARELHDGPLQEIALLARSSGSTEADLGGRLREIGAELRGLAAGLRPPTLDRFGLVPALADLAERWETAPTPLDVQLRAGDTATRFEPDVELALYRVAQEALSNASAHGRARTAWVELVANNRTAELTVCDDGAGVAPGVSLALAGRRRLLKDGHFGLVGMSERATALGGVLAIGPRPGAVGTRVHLRLPLAGTPQRR